MSVVIITIAKIGMIEVDATWLLLGLAAALFVYGFARGAMRRPDGLPLQSVAMLAFGAVAVLAVLVNATSGAYLIAAGLLAHAAWDGYHHLRNKVVAQSMAEFCFVLDVLLAVAILFATI